MADLTVKDIFNKKAIYKRAVHFWDDKTELERNRRGRKYDHIFAKRKWAKNEWSNPFDDLTSFQQRLLIKSEIIRTYDSLPNHDKTEIKRAFKLSEFASKWIKLSNIDKSKLLSVLI